MFYRQPEPLTIEQVLSSRMVSYPLTVRDCCLVTDGAGAVVLTRADRARDLRRDPVYLLGVGHAHWHRQISQMPDLTTSAATAQTAINAITVGGGGDIPEAVYSATYATLEGGIIGGWRNDPTSRMVIVMGDAPGQTGIMVK